MKIWLDVLTPKQVLFLHPLAQELKAKGHDIIATSRHYREASLLAEKVGFRLQLVGEHGGQSLYNKLKASSERVTSLAELVKDWIPDCAISFGSPECARVSFGLGLKHISINDSPHAESVARLTVPLSDMLFTPWIIPKSEWSRYGIGEEKIIRYRALDPAVWLKRREHIDNETVNDKPAAAKPTILVRLDESHASYLHSYNGLFTQRLLEELSLISEEFNVVVLCRYEPQLRDIQTRFGSKFTIPTDVVDGATLISFSDVFIGMGGTMTAEAALLGVPTISAYPGASIYTEKYLIRKGLLVRPTGVRNIMKTVRLFIGDQNKRILLKKKARITLDKMEDPTQKIISAVETDNRKIFNH